VESFDFRPSNQYILVRVIPSFFRFAKVRNSMSYMRSIQAVDIEKYFWMIEKIRESERNT
jgi:hypothetical protein